MKIVVSENQEHRLDFKWEDFTSSFEKAVRDMENFGRRLNDQPLMPDTNRLSEAYGWFHGKTGLTCQFIWQDGTKNAYAHVDAPVIGGEVSTFKKAIEYFFGNETGIKLLGMRNYHDYSNTAIS